MLLRQALEIARRPTGIAVAGAVVGSGSTRTALCYARSRESFPDDQLDYMQKPLSLRVTSLSAAEVTNVLVRGARAAVVFCRLTALYKMIQFRDAFSGNFLSKSEMAVLREEAHEKGAQLVLDLCRSNGGVFIKMGQHACSLKGAVPAAYIDALRVLQDRAPERALSEVTSVLDTELGPQWREKIVHLEEKPIGCASLAQVHRGVLYDGRQVAVKVQHKGLVQVMASDVALVRMLDSLASRLFKETQFSLAWAVEEFDHNLSAELDFKREANNCEQCKINFSWLQQRTGWCTDILVPHVFKELGSHRVITMDYIDGVPVHDLKGMQKYSIKPKAVSKLVLEALAAMIFLFGFVHADMHPGNMIVIPEKLGRTRLALLDHGLYRRFTPDFRSSNCLLWEGMILQNKAAIRQACDQMGIGDLWELLPFILVNRSPGTASGLGAPNRMNLEERRALRKRLGIAKVSASDVGRLADKLPGDMLFALKAWHLVKDLNDRLEGDNRTRFMVYARFAVIGAGCTSMANGSDIPIVAESWLWGQIRWALFLARFYWHEWAMQSFGIRIFRGKGASDAPGSELTFSSAVGDSYPQ